MSTTINLYSASELKEQFPDGFENALEHWRNDNTEIFWMDETIASLKAIVEASGLTLKDWELGAYYYSYIRIDWGYNDDTKELTGNRALAWIENNLLYKFRITKNTKDYLQYNRSYTDKSLRPYSIGKIKPCPFTGYFADEEYLDGLISAVKQGDTLEDAYNNLADECRKLLEQDVEDQNSEEGFIDHAEANEYQFTEDGQRVY